MIIQAELKCKQTGCEADPCAVDKVIELPSQRFQQFSRALLADYDFIAENKNAVRHDGDTRHCLLILDAEGKDGFLIDPQGYNYARYSAFVPNARSLLTPDMAIDRSHLSPAEPWRNENRDEMLRMTLRAEGKPETLHWACELLQDLDNYQRIVEGAYGYGQQRLQETLGLDDEAIYELDGYMDFEKYGQDCMENDGVTKTEFGLLRRLDPPFPEQRQGQRMM